MEILLIIIAALLPAVLLFFYIWRMDPRPEPMGWLVRGILFGVAICFPVAFIEMVIQGVLFGAGQENMTLVETTMQAFFVAAIPEESAKLLMLWLLLRRNPFFDEHFDGIIYAVCIGLGFAALENIFYLFGYGDEWFSVAITRALLAVPGHYAFGVLMGYYYSIYHFIDRRPTIAVSILMVPVLAHGCYDTLAMSGMASPALGGVSFVVLIYFCVRMHKFARSRMLAQIERDKGTTA